jgi:hypothetical protein
MKYDFNGWWSRRIFMAGPDDEQVEAPTFLGGTRYA